MYLAGIPDFRTPGTGLYDNLQKYDLPSPQAIFEMSYFRERPDAFYRLAAEEDYSEGGEHSLRQTILHSKFRMLVEDRIGVLLEDRGFTATGFLERIQEVENKPGWSWARESLAVSVEREASPRRASRGLDA